MQTCKNLQGEGNRHLARSQIPLSVQQLCDFTTCLSLIIFVGLGSQTRGWIFVSPTEGGGIGGSNQIQQINDAAYACMFCFSFQIIRWCVHSRNRCGESYEDGGDGGRWPHHHRHTFAEGKAATCLIEIGVTPDACGTNARIRPALLQSSKRLNKLQ